MASKKAGQKPCKRDKLQRGATLIECTIAAPFLLSILVLMLGLARYLSALLPISQGVYQLALVGGEYLPEEGPAKVQARAQQLLFRPQSPLKMIDPDTMAVSVAYDEPAGTVRLELSGKPLSLPLAGAISDSKYSIEAPILAKRIVVATNQKFGQDPLCFQGQGHYDCNLTRCLPGTGTQICNKVIKTGKGAIP